MIIKYRVHEVAKDLGVPSKDIIDFLAKYYDEPRKHMTALSEEELNLIFEHYTKEKAVEKFDEYFAANTPPEGKSGTKAAKTKAAAKKQETAPSAEKSAEAEKPAAKAKETEKPAAAANKAANKEQKPAAEAKSSAPANQPQKAQTAQAASRQHSARTQTRQQQTAAHGDRAKTAQPEQKTAQAFQGKGGPKQQNQQIKPKPQPQQKTVIQQKTKTGAVRYVNTRGAEIELDKYNEHYEEIVPENAKRATAVAGKQKIKQKSASRKPYYAKRDSEAEKLRRLQLEKQKQKPIEVSIPDEISVGELAARLKVTAATLIKKLMSLGVMASISDVIDFDTASLAAMELGAKVEKEVVLTIEDRLIDDSEDKEEDLQPRDPVVCVMGHVDHGKTSLLDAIRNTNVAAGEAGGITQSIGAYRVRIQDRDITFIDTPGHEAFTAMRARGAMITDIAILVVAADDGIMPQTVEAINHAKAAKVSIIVAINKIDKPGANPEKVKQQLTEYGLVPEEWGGDTICVPVSAVKRQNLDKLLENVLLVADINELKANPNRAAKGAVIEARLDKGKGPVATVLVQNGTLHKGDIIIAGTAVGHVRVMTDDKGNPIDTAGPSVPVEITGLSEVPEAGDIFHVVKDERMARELVEQRRQKEKEEQFKAFQKVTLDNLFSQMEQGEIKELNIIVKADVQGSVEAVRQSLEKLSNDEVRVKVIHGGVGAITDNDVKLAEASNAIIIGFNVRPDADARKSAEIAGVEIRTYRVIYDCIEEVKAAMKGMLAPKTREVQIGRVEVRQTYKISSIGTIAGCYVLEGKVTRNSLIRLVRDGIVITEDKIGSLKRFKDDVKEVVQGYECGIGLEKFNDIKVGDIFETYIIEEYRE